MASGILLLDKPVGRSSHHVMKKTQYLLGMKKAGHMGTLDVMASGMLPLCMGEATRFAGWGLRHDKVYTVTACMGEATSTGDVEGEVVETARYDHITQSDMEAILPKWIGEVDQIPPMYAALKHKGEPLYALARRGEVVERPARRVTLYKIEIIEWDLPMWKCRVHAGSGVYVRTLIEDLAREVGCVAHLKALHRNWVEPWQDQPAYRLEQIEEMGNACLLPTRSLFPTMPTITLSKEEVLRLCTGLPLHERQEKPALYGLRAENDAWLGLGVIDDSDLRVKRLFSNAHVFALLES